MATSILPGFGYSEEQIQTITSIINVTKTEVPPSSLLEKIMCDADHDYLGRKDYHVVAKTLRNELRNYGHKMNEIEWIDFQLKYLENHHHYYTKTSQNIRNNGKEQRIMELKKKKSKIQKD
jgi:hypothetical protein